MKTNRATMSNREKNKKDKLSKHNKHSKHSKSIKSSKKNKTIENNVSLTIKRVREKSPILKEMEDNGEIKIVGGVYHISTGKVTLL